MSSATTDDRRPASPASRDAARPAWRAVLSWFDASATQDGDDPTRDRVDWARILPFVGMHVACLAVFWVGVSPFAVGVAVAMYLLRMFAITGFYHRYFSHRSFKTSRAAQFVFAVLGASAVQRGPIWWAAHHRHHHAHSDRADDVHSPKQRGFVWSHMGWFLSRRHFAPDLGRVRDLLRYPELRWLGECTSSGLSECAWWWRWWAAHQIGPRCTAEAPRTAKANCAAREVLKVRWEK